MKPILIGVVAYVLLTIVLGVVWNLFLFQDTYNAISGPGRRTSPIMPLGISSMLLEGVALSLLFSRFFQGPIPVRDGVVLALLIGAFSMGYAAFVVPAKFAVTQVWKYAALELAFGVLHFGAVGALFSFIFRR
jgi:hypothetical protein